jgi:zinc/manganese transport system substrate-binding protein
VPLYLLDAVGLRNKTPDEFSEAIEEDSDVPAKVLNETLALYSGHQVKVLAYNAQTTGPETEKVLAAAKQNNIPVVPVTETLPAGKDYVGWMSGTLNALGAALGQ